MLNLPWEKTALEFLTDNAIMDLFNYLILLTDTKLLFIFLFFMMTTRKGDLETFNVFCRVLADTTVERTGSSNS